PRATPRSIREPNIAKKRSATSIQLSANVPPQGGIFAWLFAPTCAADCERICKLAGSDCCEKYRKKCWKNQRILLQPVFPDGRMLRRLRAPSSSRLSFQLLVLPTASPVSVRFS